MSAAMRAYSRAPVWLQNVLITAYGYRLRRLRYGATGRRTLAWLRSSQWLPAAELLAYQETTLRAVVARAIVEVPFYRERGGMPVPRTLEALKDLPRLAKDEVQAAGRAMVSERFARARLTEVHTGGTTGTPLAIYCDSETLQRNYAFFERFKEWAGIGPGARVATFAGRTLVPPGASAPFWRRNRAANTLLLSSYHIGARSLPAYVEELTRFQPDLIDSYPSSVEPIARYMVERGVTSIRPRAVITSSETLFPEVRSLLERAFGCRVFDHYGSAEMAALIAQCDRGSYHVAPEFGVVELLDGNREVGPGERGELVVTGFINPVMPLIRYSTGDFAVRRATMCACGRAGMVIERIEGRMDDIIVTPEGNLVGRLDPIFKAVSALHETRIVQDELDHVRVEIVARDDLSQATELELIAQLRARLGPTMRIDIIRVPRLERTARGKLRTTVNLVHATPSSMFRR